MVSDSLTGYIVGGFMKYIRTFTVGLMPRQLIIKMDWTIDVHAIRDRLDTLMLHVNQP
jgi:hypothetical protein